MREQIQLLRRVRLRLLVFDPSLKQLYKLHDAHILLIELGNKRQLVWKNDQVKAGRFRQLDLVGEQAGRIDLAPRWHVFRAAGRVNCVLIVLELEQRDSELGPVLYLLEEHLRRHIALLGVRTVADHENVAFHRNDT